MAESWREGQYKDDVAWHLLVLGQLRPRRKQQQHVPIFSGDRAVLERRQLDVPAAGGVEEAEIPIQGRRMALELNDGLVVVDLVDGHFMRRAINAADRLL